LILHIYSLVSALLVSIKEASTLKIALDELPRYLRKSNNLALCYAGFISENNRNQAINAGIAAFLCCAYDVVTDWREFDQEAMNAFDRLLKKYASPKLREMALHLLEKDRQQDLCFDGLERGITSTLFVTGLIGSTPYYEKNACISRLGMALQVVDDVLDYELDAIIGDTNCLKSNNWKEYLFLLEEVLPETETKRLFPFGLILKRVIRRSRTRALWLSSHLQSIQQ
jgi:hypothetical protein